MVVVFCGEDPLGGASSQKGSSPLLDMGQKPKPKANTSGSLGWSA